MSGWGITLSLLALVLLNANCVWQGSAPAPVPPVSTPAVSEAPGVPGSSAGRLAGINLPPMNSFSETPVSVNLKLVADGFSSPVALVPSPDGTNRLFIVDQVGFIYIVAADGKVMKEPFLDLRSRMITLDPTFDERGLLGPAFHPAFGRNGRFFVFYSAPLSADAPNGWDHTSRVSEFAVSRSDPNKADDQSERVILEADQPTIYHHAGQIVFGPDGYLYIPLGDGRPWENGQDITTLLGKILRIDVDGGTPYSSPADNPFVGKEGCDEIFALGFRNPFRISFDSAGDRELFAGDAGEALWEEVDIVTRGGNYGWNIKEGTHCFDLSDALQPLPDCPATDAAGQPLIDPIIEYPHAGAADRVLGTAVIGGFVYRGNALPALQGCYVFGDFSASASTEMAGGRLFAATRPQMGSEMWSVSEIVVAGRDIGRVDAFILSFGQDADNELYVLVGDQPAPSGNTGKVYKIVP